MEETTDNRPQETTDLFGNTQKTPAPVPQEEPAKPLFGESASPVPGAVPLFGGAPTSSSPVSERQEKPLFAEENGSREPEPSFRREEPASVPPVPEVKPAAVEPSKPAAEKRGVLHPSADVDSMGVGSLMTSIREQAGYTVEDAASVTRIKRLYIEAIEKERFEDLPSGSLPYAYIRTLCNIYGVEPELSEQILAKARTIKRTEAEFPEKIITHVGSTITRNEKEEKRFMRIILCAGAGIVLILLGLIALVIWWLLPSGEKANASSGTDAEESSAVSSAVPGRHVNDALFDPLTAPALPKSLEFTVPGSK